jgi:uncharacterized protein (DUF302 family)
MEYGFSKTTSLSFDEAIEKATAELKKEGFGVLTTIDVKDTLKKKINVDFKRYTILGACNPPYAYKALSAEAQIGLLLPCNVVIHENENNEVVVSVFNPEIMNRLIENVRIAETAKEIKEKLVKVLNNI